MATIDDVIRALRRLTPDQVDTVARIIDSVAQRDAMSPPRGPSVSMVDDAIRHGWPAQLFTELIGSLPDLERPAQPPAESRPEL